VVPTLEELLTRWDDVYLNIDAKADETVAPLITLVDRLTLQPRVHRLVLDRRVARIRTLARGRICSSMGQVASAMAYVASRSGRCRASTRLPAGPWRWGRLTPTGGS